MIQLLQFGGEVMPLSKLPIQLDFRSDLPIYVQIVNQIAHLVRSGTLKPGDQLPTVRALAQELRINFNTVARAYRLLDEAGIISTQQGRGTYILEGPSPATDQNLKAQNLEALSERYLQDAVHLGFSPEEVLAFLQEYIARRLHGEATNHATQ